MVCKNAMASRRKPNNRTSHILSHSWKGCILFFAFMILASIHCSRNIVITNKGIIVSTVRASIRKYDSPNWEIRRNAIRDLAKNISASDDGLIEMALLVSSKDVHPAVRIESLKGMAALKSKNTFGRISEIALLDDNNNVRWYAIKTLALFNEKSSFDVFSKSYASDDWLLREASIEGLMDMDIMMEKEKVIPYAVKGMNDPSENVKIATLINVRIRDEKLFTLIKEIFKKKKNTSHPLLRASLTAMNGYMLDSKTRGDVIDLLSHDNKEIRLLAFKVLKQESLMKRLGK